MPGTVLTTGKYNDQKDTQSLSYNRNSNKQRSKQENFHHIICIISKIKRMMCKRVTNKGENVA